MLARLLDVGREEKLSRIVAEILPENLAMARGLKGRQIGR
jgi:hypothetical protein